MPLIEPLTHIYPYSFSYPCMSKLGTPLTCGNW
jgi:hypothetical protein